MIEEIFPKFDFSTGNSINFKPSGGAAMAENYKAWWVYNTPYRPTRFTLRENYKCPLWTLHSQILRPSDGSERVVFKTT